MTLRASLGQDCIDLLLGTWLQVGYISARHENSLEILEVDVKSIRVVRSCQVCRANSTAPHCWVQSQRPQEIHKVGLLKNERRTGNCDTSMEHIRIKIWSNDIKCMRMHQVTIWSSSVPSMGNYHDSFTKWNPFHIDFECRGVKGYAGEYRYAQAGMLQVCSQKGR